MVECLLEPPGELSTDSLLLEPPGELSTVLSGSQVVGVCGYWLQTEYSYTLGGVGSV